MSTDLRRWPFLFVLLLPTPNFCINWNLAAANGSRGLPGWPAWLAGAFQTRLPGQSFQPCDFSFACAAFARSRPFKKIRSNYYSVVQVGKLKAFLRKHEQFLPHVVAIANVGDGGGGFKDAYAVLVGVGQYLRHFARAGKGRPNAEIKFDPSEGFNIGALALHCTTRNFSGISEGKEIVVDFGASYAFDDCEQPAAKKFRGALDVLFAKYQTAQSDAPDEPNPLESTDTGGQPPAKLAKVDAGQKVAAAEVAAATVVAEQLPSVGATPAVLPAVGQAVSPSPSQPNCGGVIVSEHNDPTFTITLQDGALYYNSDNAKNRKIEKELMYKTWHEGQVIRKEDIPNMANGGRNNSFRSHADRLGLGRQAQKGSHSEEVLQRAARYGDERAWLRAMEQLGVSLGSL